MYVLCIGGEKSYRQWFEVKNHSKSDSAGAHDHKLKT